MQHRLNKEIKITLELTPSELATLIAAYGSTSSHDREQNFQEEDNLVKQYSFDKKFSDDFYLDARKILSSI